MRCCLSYKDTILKANHNTTGRDIASYPMLLILQRYYFESESQHDIFRPLFLSRCCLSYKDTILKANHNISAGASLYRSMLLILQRYYFESESQLAAEKLKTFCDVAYPTKILFWKRITTGPWYTYIYIRCCLSYKDTILKANHNIICHLYQSWPMLLILQRYYFESESQHNYEYGYLLLWCCLSYKDTILKANHNASDARTFRFQMLLILQRYYFESESQHIFLESKQQFGCCLSYKDTILKANHNMFATEIIATLMLLILQRYYFESESQHAPNSGPTVGDVAYPTKILFWKRITTAATYISILAAMLLILQRYYFESESQLDGVDSYKDAGCCLSYKDTILKANHNYFVFIVTFFWDVAYPTKILFWKRITTSKARWITRARMLLILQRYYFESESQRYQTRTSCDLRCCLSYKDTILKANHNK